MKIFISHSSENRIYGEVLVGLLREIGIGENEIIFTSNVAYGIPNGQNIFNWLKCQITEKPYVIYLLSKEYYSSVACLNEMGAAWIIENAHTMIFTPEFDLSCNEFQSGAIDPREIGFFIDNEDRLHSFIEQLRANFDISKNTVLINQSVKKYLSTIDSINKSTVVDTPKNSTTDDVKSVSSDQNINHRAIQDANTKENYVRLVNNILEGKLTIEEKLLLHYIITTGKTKLKIGWQAELEISDIKSWEEIEGLNDTLSQRYADATNKFQLRKYVDASAFTSSGNPKELKLKDDIGSMILDFPMEVIAIINQTVGANQKSSSIDW